jgi:hypothetical protein
LFVLFQDHVVSKARYAHFDLPAVIFGVGGKGVQLVGYYMIHFLAFYACAVASLHWVGIEAGHPHYSLISRSKQRLPQPLHIVALPLYRR